MNPARRIPWYRHGYVWLLVFFPALSVAGGLTTLWLAAKTYDGLVVDDYYKHGLQINAVKARDQAAVDYGLVARLDLEGDLRISLQGNDGFTPPANIEVSFLHRTRAGLDRQVTLSRIDGTDVYAGPAPDLAAGDWHVLIEADDWRLLESMQRR
jgi:hypothetical protein